MSTLATNLGLIAAAILTKLSGSVDDVVWLMPFLSPTGKTSFLRLLMACTYIMVMLLVTCCAIAVSVGGKRLFEHLIGDESTYWNAQRVLSFASGIILTLYTLYLFYEWWNERNEEDDEPERVDEVDKSASSSQTPSDLKAKSNSEISGGSGNAGNHEETEMVQLTLDEQESSDDEDTPTKKENGGTKAGSSTNKFTLGRLVVVALAGSLDDFAVQSALLLAGTFLWYHLLIGVLIGTITVVFICFCIGYVRCIVKYIEKVPIWVIIGALAIYTMIETFYDV